jgi:hypothetical protein
MRHVLFARSVKRIALLLVAVLTLPSTPAAVRDDHAAYVGGTVEIPIDAHGKLDLTDGTHLRFTYSTGGFALSYASITSMEFGQKIGRRIGATVALGVTTLGLGASPMLLSKKRRHFLTLGYTGRTGAAEAVVFELSKGICQAVLPTLEARTGKRVEIISDGKNTPEVQHSIVASQAPAATAVPVPPRSSTTAAPVASATVPTIPSASGLVPMSFVSNPPGALVSFSGMRVCYTPCVTKLEPGHRHKVKMTLAGYTDWAGEITIEAGKPSTVVADLHR